MLYCSGVLSAINHKYISSSQLKIQTRNLWWRFILISSICTQSIMTTPRSLDKKKITRWSSTRASPVKYPPMLTSIAVDILGSERSCMKTSLSVVTHVMSRVVAWWWPGVLSGLLATDTCWTRGAAGGERDAARTKTILCCPTHWVSQTPQTTRTTTQTQYLLCIHYLVSTDYRNYRQHTLQVFFLRSGLQVIMLGSSIWSRYLFYYFMTKEVQHLVVS